MIHLSEEFDIVILGRGAAAFSAAIKASEITSGQASIAMIGYGPVGGTCVNVGCVPSKYLLEASQNVSKPLHPRMKGINGSKVDFDFKSIMEGLRDYVEHARNSKYEDVINQYKNVTLFEGKARFSGPRTVEIVDLTGRKTKEITGSNFIIATGSTPAVPKIDGIEKIKYLTSDNIWQINKLPERIAVVGGGAIGLELGQALLNFGSSVTVIEALDSLIPQSEPEIGAALRNRLANDGMKFYLRARIGRVDHDSHGYRLDVITHRGKEAVNVDEVLIATGRKPNTSDLNLETAGVKTDERGLIITDRNMRTSSRFIFAAGDCVSKKLFLETLAAREGVVAASNIFGQDMEIDYESATWAVFTYPQIAGVGLTENEFSRKKGSCECRVFPLSNLTKATIMGEGEGIIKITINPLDKRIVGMHIFSPNATDIITEGAYAIRNGFKVEDIIATSHIFPSLSEGVKLAAQSFIRDISMMSCCVE